tara:strand:+ start:488 stop:1414 length:927 start_codon:yes stop_codon:yes gene_type:complete
MAFKFKVKKRPSMGQAVAASFASGVGQGIQAGGKAALQQMIQDRAAKKDNANKELSTFNSLISGLPSSPTNRAAIIQARVAIADGGASAISAVEALGLTDGDFQTDAEKRSDRKDQESIVDRDRIISKRGREDRESIVDRGRITSQREREDTQRTKLETKDEIIGVDEAVQQGMGMSMPTPTPLEVEQRTAQSELALGLTTASKETQFKAWDTSQMREVRATESEIENSNGILIFGGKPTASSEDKITKNQELNALEDAIKGAKTSMILANNDPIKKEAIQKQLTKFEARRDTLLLDDSISSKPKIEY